ncbi:AbrB/MazE/SpoVT family DNA-binding domain-containing protein [Bacillus taeanensis]|uniref:AbrB family transcriptional regulator n=1 Tax=Bacillus taeanensis TaxID=273032 RepID=A0A366XQ57_9BACI|nr:AbrB/MazE/SpoVT family DNA-binding domain-containing protein [Bacillus taeanensis]RBW68047.1 AbrB family transcriptional regulator [Bacillus taeanensis]
MKSTGIVRKIDDLGRIVIPKSIRKHLDIEVKDPIEIFLDTDKIVLRKYFGSEICIFCGSGKDVLTFKQKHICKSCTAEIEVTHTENVSAR